MKRLVALVAVQTLFSIAQLPAQQTQVYPDVLNEVRHDTSPPLRDVQTPLEVGRTQVAPLLHPPHEVKKGQEDLVVQKYKGPQRRSVRTLSASGVGSSGILPSDANGAAGTTQYVQWVNTYYAVFNKSTGAIALGPLPGNSLWANFGGPCETYNFGDPIVQYDKAANRWVMAQPVYQSPYVYCIAVSTTSDATGSYNRYAFSMPNFPDYPKLAVWPDAYYASFNLFQGSDSGPFVGAYACAFDRSAMLAGKAATAQCFTAASESSFLPSDLDGSTPPPAGSPDYFVDLNPGSSPALNLYKFHVDFVTPSKTTFTGPVTIPVAAFSEACSQFGYTYCIQQPLSQGVLEEVLDSMPDRLMYRLAYRNFGDHESLVANHSVNANASVGVRWYELRNPGGTPIVYQQGTYAPDSSFRWMPSIAMDHSGDIAVGYSVSSTSLYPSIRYTGRVPGDPLGTLESESSIVEGAYEQMNQYRWGDYTGMAIDPVDDCTFWYTNQYVGASSWLTRIASFKFANCGSAPSPDFSLTPSPASHTVTQGNSANYTVSVTPLNGFTGSVSFSTGSLPLGVSASFNPTASPSSTTLTLTTASTTPTGTYTITVDGVSGALNHTLSLTLVVNAAPTPDFSIAATPSTLTMKHGSSGSYSITVTALNGFTGTVTLSAGGFPSRTSVRFSSSTITGSGSSTLTVSPSKKAPAGTYPVTISGTDGSLTHSVNVNLTLN